jgi:hypothetical protein
MNGVDDDGDGIPDILDPGCTSTSDGDETDDCPSGPGCPACSNDVDDDGDGSIDEVDAECGLPSDDDERCILVGEGFDGAWPGSWTTDVGIPPMASRRLSAAHDGAFGLRDPMFPTFLPGITFGSVGDVASVWTKTQNDPTGTVAGLHVSITTGASPTSYACAVNLAQELAIWSVTSAGVDVLGAVPAVRERDRWYRLEIAATAPDAIACRIFADGEATPLATLTRTLPGALGGPVGVRGFPLADFDTLEVCR